MEDLSSPSPEKRDAFIERVLERIQDPEVTPRPRWQFVLENATRWVLWIVCVILGAVVVAAVVFALMNAGWEFRTVTHNGIFPFLFETLPFVWLGLLIVALLAAYRSMRHTRHGYRYPFVLVVGLGVLGSVAIGVGLYATGIGQRVEEGWGSRIPLQRPAIVHQYAVWTDPARGLLSGAVTAIQPEQDLLYLRTFDGAEWAVNLEDVSVAGREDLRPNQTVRVIGLPMGTSTMDAPFHACFVFPWQVRGSRASFVPASPRPFTRSAPSPSMGWLASDCAHLPPFPILKRMEER